MTTYLMAIGFSPQVRAWITHQGRNHPKCRIAHHPLGQRIHLRGKQSCKAPIKKASLGGLNAVVNKPVVC